MSVEYTVTPPWRWHWLVNTKTLAAVKCLAWRERVNEWIVHEHVDLNSFSPDTSALFEGEWQLANECETRKGGE